MYTLFLLYCTYCTIVLLCFEFEFCTYCTLLYSIVQYFVQYCTLILCTKLHIVRPPLARCPPAARRLAGLIPLLLLFRPIPAVAPRRVSCNANHQGALYFSETRQLRTAVATYAAPPPPPAAGGGAPLRCSKGSTKPSTFFMTRVSSTISTMG